MILTRIVAIVIILSISLNFTFSKKLRSNSIVISDVTAVGLVNAVFEVRKSLILP